MADASSIEHATLLANGHVLLTSPEAFFVWDPSGAVPLRRVDLQGDAAAEGVSALAQTGNTRFVVARANGGGPLTLELWDAERLVALRPLEGRFRDSRDTSNRAWSFSRDRSRFLFMGCGPVTETFDSTDCEACVYALPEGARVHCTKMPPLMRQGYVGSVDLSPTGRFFTFSEYFIPTEFRDSSSGAVLLRIDGSNRSSLLDPRGREYMFIDERRLVTTVSHGNSLRLMDLATGRPLGDVTTKVPAGIHEFLNRISPDNTRVATFLTVGGEHTVRIWNIDKNTSTNHAIAASACKACELYWRRPTELVVYEDIAKPAVQLRVDVESGVQTSEPFEVPPEVVAGGFEAFGGPRAMAPRATVVVTPTGARVELPGVETRLANIDVFGERLIATSPHAVTVVGKDGSTSELRLQGPPK